MNLKEQAEKRYNEALQARADIAADFEARLAALPEDSTADDVQVISTEMTPQLDAAGELVERTKAHFDQVDTIARARAAAQDLIPAGDLSVKEARVYNEKDVHGPQFFSDLYRFQTRGDRSALDRLERNTRQTVEGYEERGTVIRDAEGRALSSTSGAGGDFLPPLYFGDLYAEFKRARRVTAQLVRNLPLAAQGNTITIPRVTAGSSTAAQQDNQNVSNTDATTAIVTIPVCTVAGYMDLSRQIVERSEPGLDQIIIEDLLHDYNKRVNFYVVNGSGSSGQPTGLLNQSGINAITFTTGSPTVPLLYPKILDSVRQITEAVFEPTVGLVMTARRWAWILAAVDSQNRPLATPIAQGPFNALGVHSDANASFVDNMVPAGTFAGYPVWIDETIPKTIGAGTNQDAIIAAAFNEHILWEDPAGPRQFTFEGVTSQTAAIRVQVFGYMAFTGGRYPAATSAINGTGLVAPTF